MSRLFLGNIPNSATESDIASWLQSHGVTVECVDIITDRATGLKRGFGFANVVDAQDTESTLRQSTEK